MKKGRKIVYTGIVIAALLMVTVLPTLSWLSSKTEPVVNKFAGGVISLTLDESAVDTDGKAIPGAARVKVNSYKYTAGSQLDKDPTVTVLKGSEACYVFLMVENGLNEKFAINYDTESWLKVAESNGKTLYAYKAKVDALKSETDSKLPPIFTTINVSETLTSDDIAALGEKTLSVTAFAVQTANVDAKTACDLAIEQFEMSGATVTVPDIA